MNVIRRINFYTLYDTMGGTLYIRVVCNPSNFMRNFVNFYGDVQNKIESHGYSNYYET